MWDETSSDFTLLWTFRRRLNVNFQEDAVQKRCCLRQIPQHARVFVFHSFNDGLLP